MHSSPRESKYRQLKMWPSHVQHYGGMNWTDTKDIKTNLAHVSVKNPEHSEDPWDCFLRGDHPFSLSLFTETQSLSDVSAVNSREDGLVPWHVLWYNDMVKMGTYLCSTNQWTDTTHQAASMYYKSLTVSFLWSCTSSRVRFLFQCVLKLCSSIFRSWNETYVCKHSDIWNGCCLRPLAVGCSLHLVQSISSSIQ